ncbi:hypothetical protein MAM1_0054c03537 [Mucor ambiguus]|uniref:F-box domain-containing protein n=1 Tax=Mucor ambiguus TaxID=91626 RepID=A0A0C9MPY1_9FUNG|nr:hypothetical protein MAM1_0054c03537 [Mucor ambiguus]
MAVSGDRLPVEVWLNIFNQIEDKQQLAQCKQTCKKWAPLVEKAMLKTVVLTAKNTRKLYWHLLMNLSSARYIQVIDIPKYTIEDLPNIKEILTVAMTPNLKAIRGSVWTYSFIDIIADIAAQRPPGYLKLEAIPETALCNSGYVSLVYLLRKTLRSLHLGLVKETILEYTTLICDNLNQFESLTNLRLLDIKQYIDSIPKLDSMLKDCPHLQSLLIMVDQSSIRTATGDLDAWLLQNVQKVNSMKTISIRNSPLGSRFGEAQDISSGFNMELLQYLSFKYPKVEHVKMDSYNQKNHSVIQPLFENADIVELQNWKVDTVEHVKQNMDIWRSQNNSIAIQYRDTRSSTDYFCNMNVDRVREANHTKFTLTDIHFEVPTEMIKQLVSSLGITLTKNLEIDLIENQAYNTELISPLAILQTAPLIEHLKVKSYNLVQELPLAPLTQLHTLELDNIRLEAKDIADIASWAPHLKHLTLLSCKFTASRDDFEELLDRNITLPELALSSLTVEGDMSSQDLWILFITAKHQLQLFYAAPSQPIVQIALEEYDLRDQDAESIIITCKSLKHLSLSIDSVLVEMEFDEEGNLTESDPSTVTSNITQLKLELQALSAENVQLKTENQAVTTKYEQAKKHLTDAQIHAIEKQGI